MENLCAGDYNLTVTDFDGCIVATSGKVSEPPLLTSSIIDSSNVDCFGDCDGFATVSPQGGTAPYTYQWNDNESQFDITATGLCGQNYVVVVTDSKGCLDTTSVSIQQPDELISSIVSLPTNCSNTWLHRPYCFKL